MNPEPNPKPTTSNRTYPLGLLFLVLTCAAILAAAVGPLLRSAEVDWSNNSVETAIAAMISTLAGAAIGALVGLFHFDRLAGTFAGSVVGSALGPLTAILYAVGARSGGVVAPAVIVGSVILLLIAWLIRPARPDQTSRT